MRTDHGEGAGAKSPPLKQHDVAAPASRVVLLGASNLTRGICPVVQIAWRTLGSPLEIFAALGHGRSYGTRAGILARSWPGILESEMWSDLERLPSTPTAALITDIGNDLLYEVQPSLILGWVEGCLERLQRVGARTVMTLLPIAGIQTLAPARYLFFRTLYVPRCRLDLAEMARRACELNEALIELGGRSGITLVEPRPEWYGLDPIHLRRRAWSGAWSEFLSPWGSLAGPADATQGPACQVAAGHTTATPSPPGWCRLHCLLPARSWWFGIEFRRSQPAAVLPDGTKFWLY